MKHTIKLNELVRQEYNKLLILEGFKEAKKRFMKENPFLTNDILNYYFKRLKELQKSSNFIKKVKENYPHINNPKNIDEYKTFSELEHSIDAFEPNKKKNNKSTDQNATEIEGANLIYDKDDIEIYLGNSEKACVKARESISSKTNRNYSYCIALNDSRNLYSSYRYGNLEPTFYFVLNRNKPITDIYHVCVIHVYNNSSTTNIYGFSNAENTGDSKLSWDQIVNTIPEIKNLKSIFKYVPLSKEEQKMKIAKVQLPSSVTDIYNHFNKDQELVEYYVSIHDLTEDQFINLPERYKLKMLSLGAIEFTVNELKSLSPKLSNLYVKYVKRAIDEKYEFSDVSSFVKFINNAYEGLDENQFKQVFGYLKPELDKNPLIYNFLNNEIAKIIGFKQQDYIDIKLDPSDLDNISEKNGAFDALLTGDFYSFIDKNFNIYDIDGGDYDLSDLDRVNVDTIKDYIYNKIKQDYSTPEEFNENNEELNFSIDTFEEIKDQDIEDLEPLIKDTYDEIDNWLNRGLSYQIRNSIESEIETAYMSAVTDMNYFYEIENKYTPEAKVLLKIPLSDMKEHIDLDYLGDYTLEELVYEVIQNDSEILNLKIDEPYYGYQGDYNEKDFNSILKDYDIE